MQMEFSREEGGMLNSPPKRIKLAIAGAVVVLAGGFGLAFTATSAHGAGTQAGEDLTFHQQRDLPITAEGFSHGTCSPIPADQDGWHFVFPQGTFDTLTATFVANGTTITRSEPIFQPNNKHAYVGTPPGAELVSVIALRVVSSPGPKAPAEYFLKQKTKPLTKQKAFRPSYRAD